MVSALPSNPTVLSWASEPYPLSPENLIPSTTGLVRRQDRSLLSSGWDKGDHASPLSLDRKTTNTQDPDKHKHRHTQLRQDSLPAPKRRESVPEAQPSPVPRLYSGPRESTSHHTHDYLRSQKGATTPDRQVSTGGNPTSQVHLERPACNISHPGHRLR